MIVPKIYYFPHLPLEGGPAQREHRCAGTQPYCVWLKVPHPSWAFAVLPIFSPTIIFFLLVSRNTLHISVLPFLLHFFQFLVLPNCFVPAFSLPKFSWACPHESPPPAYFLSHLSTLSFHVLPFPPASPFPYFPCFPSVPRPKSFWACPLEVSPPAYILSLYPSLPYLPVLWILLDFRLLCL